MNGALRCRPLQSVHQWQSSRSLFVPTVAIIARNHQPSEMVDRAGLGVILSFALCLRMVCIHGPASGHSN